MYPINSSANQRTVIQASKHRGLDHALRSDRLRVERYRALAAHGSTRAEAEEQSTNSQWHLLDPPRWRTMARSARALRALHDGLQSLQPLAESRYLGSLDGRCRQSARRPRADDRQ